MSSELSVIATFLTSLTRNPQSTTISFEFQARWFYIPISIVVTKHNDPLN